MTDVELLEQHRTGGSDEAFADIVRRHVGWVHALARRRLRDSHGADDVAQAVFVLLHRKAPRFAADGAMINWLHTAARYAAEASARGESRRRTREAQAARARPEADADRPAPGEWDELAPLLDELIAKLNRADREAVLLRFYRGMSFAEVAAEMSCTAEAARKRVARAIEKLRRHACRRGVTPTDASMLMILSQQGAAPPVGLVATTTGAATSCGGGTLAASCSPIVKGVIQMMTFQTLKLALTTGLVTTVLVATSTWLIRAAGAKGGSSPSAAVATTRPTTPDAPAARAIPSPAQDTFPKLSPFSAVRWREPATPDVQVNGTWYELVAIDDDAFARIVDFARQAYGDRWQKRFEEDLVEVLIGMGARPGVMVNLQLRSLDTGEALVMKDVMMTEENRRQIWQSRRDRGL